MHKNNLVSCFFCFCVVSCVIIVFPGIRHCAVVVVVKKWIIFSRNLNLDDFFLQGIILFVQLRACARYYLGDFNENGNEFLFIFWPVILLWILDFVVWEHCGFSFIIFWDLLQGLFDWFRHSFLLLAGSLVGYFHSVRIQRSSSSDR